MCPGSAGLPSHAGRWHTAVLLRVPPAAPGQLASAALHPPPLPLVPLCPSLAALLVVRGLVVVARIAKDVVVVVHRAGGPPARAPATRRRRCRTARGGARLGGVLLLRRVRLFALDALHVNDMPVLRSGNRITVMG